MKKEDINRVINNFFKGKYSEEGKRLFAAWMLAESDSIEKEKALKSLWQESAAKQPSAETMNEWKQMKTRIHNESLPLQKTVRPFWTSFAAAIALILVLSTTTVWWISSQGYFSTEVSMMESFAQYGERKKMMLSDGTQVELSAGSLLVYPENFNNTKTRSVYLTGEAFFIVALDKEKPFIVKASQMNVEALGTQFTVEAYNNEPEVRATLEEGSVSVQLHRFKEKSFVLKIGEQLAYDKKKNIVNIRDIDLNDFRMSRSGYLIFENATFRQIINELERKYQIVIQYNGGKYLDGYYNVKFAPDERLEEVMEVLRYLINIDYQIKENIVYIK